MLDFDHGFDLNGTRTPNNILERQREGLRQNPDRSALVDVQQFRNNYEAVDYAQTKRQSLAYHYPPTMGFRINQRCVGGVARLFVTYRPDLHVTK